MKYFILTIMVFLSCGCVPHTPTYHTSHTTHPHSKPDIPPRHTSSVPHSRVRPQAEPMSRYGNPVTYTVNGKCYDVMTSFTGYKKRGIASWYGHQFHAHRTSSGEKYNMYDMTAAHRTLPIPSYIKVKNLKNHREAIVRVNDRGPFYANRLVDLSYAAARHLGLLPQGTASVEIQALTVKPHVAHYYIQAAAFRSQQLARQLYHKLSYWPHTPPLHMINHQKQYIISIGPFPNKQALNIYKQKLKTIGLNHPIIYLH